MLLVLQKSVAIKKRDASTLLSNLVMYVGRLYLCKVIHNYYVTSTVLYSLHSFTKNNFLSVKLMRYLLPFLPLYGKTRKRQNMYDCITYFLNFSSFWLILQSMILIMMVICLTACVHVCVLIPQLCLTLCDLMDCSLLGSSVHGILQAGILEWGAVSFSRGSSQPRDQTQVFCIVDIFFTIRESHLPPGKPIYVYRSYI